MSFLLKTVLGGGIGGGLLNPVKNAASGLFSVVGSAVSTAGSVFSGILGAGRTAASVISSPFRVLSSPLFWVPVGLMAIGGVYVLTSRR